MPLLVRELFEGKLDVKREALYAINNAILANDRLVSSDKNCRTHVIKHLVEECRCIEPICRVLEWGERHDDRHMALASILEILKTGAMDKVREKFGGINYYEKLMDDCDFFNKMEAFIGYSEEQIKTMSSLIMEFHNKSARIET